MEIEFFDDMIAVAVAIISGIFAKVGPAMTFEKVTHFFFGFAATQVEVEVEATLLIWKEKIRFDLVRPTTLLQHPSRNGGSKRFVTFAGPGKGVAKITTKDSRPTFAQCLTENTDQGLLVSAEEWPITPRNGCRLPYQATGAFRSAAVRCWIFQSRKRHHSSCKYPPIVQ